MSVIFLSFISCFNNKLIYILRYCGHSSVVERLVANEKVEGSTPFARSKKYDRSFK